MQGRSKKGDRQVVEEKCKVEAKKEADIILKKNAR
jgi:hypothetical protein